MFDPRFSLVGFIIGSLIGLTGVGGGALMTPLLILLFGVNPLTAVGTDLAYSAITKIVGAITHYRQKTVDLKVAGYLVAGGVPASVLGVQLLNLLGKNQYSVDSFIRITMGVALILTGVFMFLQTSLIKKGFKFTGKALSQLNSHLPFYTVVVGFIVGLLVGITSVGSGVLIVVFLLLLHPIQDKKVVGTDIMTAMFILIFAGMTHFLIGTVNTGLVGTLLLGSIPGVYIGSKIHLKFPMRYLRVILSIIILLSGIALMLD